MPLCPGPTAPLSRPLLQTPCACTCDKCLLSNTGTGCAQQSLILQASTLRQQSVPPSEAIDDDDGIHYVAHVSAGATTCHAVQIPQRH